MLLNLDQTLDKDRGAKVGDVSEVARLVYDLQDVPPLGVAYFPLIVEEAGDSKTWRVNCG